MQNHTGHAGGGFRPQGGGGYNDFQYGGGGGNNTHHRRGGSEHNMYARGNNFAYPNNAEELLDDNSLAFDEAFGTDAVGPPQFTQNHQNRLQHYNPSAGLVRDNLGGNVNNTNPTEKDDDVTG